MSRSGVAAAVLLCVFLVLAGCAGQSAPASPAQVLHSRLAALVSAHWLVLDGTVSMQGVAYPVTLNEDDRSGATGSVTVEQKSIAVTWNGGRLFIMNPDYLVPQQIHTGKHWALVHNDKLATLVGALVNRKALAGALQALAGPHLSQRPGTTVKGVATVQLVSDTLTATVPAGGGPPLRLATALDQQLSDGLSDLKLDVAASNAALTVTPPPAFVDPADRNSLPAYFEEVSAPPDPFQWSNCDAQGCTISDSFRNEGGRLDTAGATFVIQSGGTQLGSCSVQIPPTDSGGTVRVSCRVNYDTSSEVQGSVDIVNPT